MSLRVTEHSFTGSTTLITSYDSTKTNLGADIYQKTGATSIDKFAGPRPIAVARPGEATTAIYSWYPHVLSYSSTVDWIFLTENTTTGTTRRCILYTFDKEQAAFTWKGFVTMNLQTAATHTTRAFRVIRDLYTTGTASASGTACTGVGTTWQTDRLAVGARIGFGSADPTAISTWYYINTIGSDTTITLDRDAGTIAGGSYVIEEIRLVLVTTNNTLANGGLWFAKGANFDSFTPTGTNIPAATNVDNIRATYWLADAEPVTNTVGGGVALLDRADWQTQFIFVGNGTTTMQYFKYNLRAALTVASAKTTSAFVLKTGVSPTLTGTAAQVNSHRQGSLTHWQSGASCVFFATSTRIYYSLVSDLTSGKADFLGSPMTEIPPGGTSTYAATATMGSVEVSSLLDRLYITTTSPRMYLTRFNNTGDAFDHVLLSDDRQIDHSGADAGTTPHPTYNATVLSVWSEGGTLYICRNGGAVTTNHIWAVPMNVDWQYASSTSERLMTPSMSTTNAVSLEKCYVNGANIVGSTNLGTRPEPYRIYARTSGISDNTGSWVAVSDTGDISALTATNEIQFMFEFRIISQTCIPGRLFNLCVVYNDGTSDAHFQPSVGLSNLTDKRFAWRFATAFSTTVPDLRVKLYNAVTGALLVNDLSTSATGTFEVSTNGGSSWSAWAGADKGNDTTYIRYTPASLGDDITVKAILATE